MKATVMIDNIAKDGLSGEWGLAVLIEYNGKQILLDTGASEVFMENAKALGLDLKEVDYGVLSHAHFDHSDGMDVFLDENVKAGFYLREGSCENCFSLEPDGEFKYIGIKRGVLEKYKDRIQYVSGDYELMPGAALIPHKTPGLEKIAERVQLYKKMGEKYLFDDFSHEQSLVLETEKGLVIFNSCSHGGADNIIKEVAATYPGKKIYAMIGGFHLFKSTKEEVLQFANRVLETGIEKVVTGHCTGDEAFVLLKEVLGDKVEQICSGYTIEI